jgi:hypothetical protein
MCLKVVSISDVNLSLERHSIATSDWSVLLLVQNNLRVSLTLLFH